MNQLKQIIIERYGSVDNFIAETNIKVSRIHLYKLLAGERTNPTLEILNELSHALNMTLGEIADALRNRH